MSDKIEINISNRVDQLADHHSRHRCADPCDHCHETERLLRMLQQEVSELLRRVPAPDTTPTHISVTAS